MPPRVHFVFAIEARPAYLNMARLLAYSIRHRAGRLADSRVTVVFNDHDDDGRTASFLRKRLDVECVALPRVSHELHYLNKYTALHSPNLHEADWIIQLDADTAIIHPLDDLEATFDDPQLDFAGVPVLALPIWGIDQVFLKYTGLTHEEIDATRHPWFPCEYPYFNGGVIMFNGKHLALFRDQIVPLGEELRRWMRAGGGGPIKWLRNQWNRIVADRPSLSRLVISPYFPRNAGDQLAIPILVLKHHLNYNVLPHAYNWRMPDAGQGEDDPIRILHYLGARFPINRGHLFDSPWIDEYARSSNPGERELAKLVGEFNDWNKPRMTGTGRARNSPDESSAPATQR